MGGAEQRGARNAALDIGFVPGPLAAHDDVKFVYLLGADDVDMDAIPEDSFAVYQGSHGEKGAHRADVVQTAIPSSGNALPGVVQAWRSRRRRART